MNANTHNVGKPDPKDDAPNLGEIDEGTTEPQGTLEDLVGTPPAEVMEQVARDAAMVFDPEHMARVASENEEPEYTELPANILAEVKDVLASVQTPGELNPAADKEFEAMLDSAFQHGDFQTAYERAKAENPTKLRAMLTGFATTVKMMNEKWDDIQRMAYIKGDQLLAEMEDRGVIKKAAGVGAAGGALIPGAAHAGALDRAAGGGSKSGGSAPSGGGSRPSYVEPPSGNPEPTPSGGGETYHGGGSSDIESVFAMVGSGLGFAGTAWAIEQVATRLPDFRGSWDEVIKFSLMVGAFYGAGLFWFKEMGNFSMERAVTTMLVPAVTATLAVMMERGRFFSRRADRNTNGLIYKDKLPAFLQNDYIRRAILIGINTGSAAIGEFIAS